MSKIQQFWEEFLKHTDQKDVKYLSHFHFELNETLAEELLELVLKGQKKATASSLNSFEIEGEDLPSIGDYHIVTDFYGNPYCVIQTTQVTMIPFHEMTYEICRREGEDETLESWQKGHRRFFQEEAKIMGYMFSESLIVVFEDFEVVYKRS